MLAAERLDVEHDVGDVLAHARHRRELVQHAVDLDRVIAAPCSEDSSMRRRALPRVMPKPRSSGSATTSRARGSSPGSTSSRFGLIRSCQFFWITVFLSIPIGPRPIPHKVDARQTLSRPAAHERAACTRSDAAALAADGTVVRDRRHVADRRDR